MVAPAIIKADFRVPTKDPGEVRATSRGNIKSPKDPQDAQWVENAIREGYLRIVEAGRRKTLAEFAVSGLRKRPSGRVYQVTVRFIKVRKRGDEYKLRWGKGSWGKGMTVPEVNISAADRKVPDKFEVGFTIPFDHKGSKAEQELYIPAHSAQFLKKMEKKRYKLVVMGRPEPMKM